MRKDLENKYEYSISNKFNKEGFYPPILSSNFIDGIKKTEFSEYDKSLIELVEDASNKIINTINSIKGDFFIMVSPIDILININLKLNS